MEAFINMKNSKNNVIDELDDNNSNLVDKEDNLPTDNLPTDNLPTDNLPTDNLPTDNLPTDNSLTNSENINYTFNGLNLLCDPRKKKNFNIGKVSSNKFYTDLKNFNIEIDEFKDFMTERIIKFDINKRIDYHDDQILSCYYHFIYRKIDKNKLYNFICSFKD